ncbi:MAG: flavohemoprotein [Cyanobacteria bacterium RM1_2_2]|nr:flavohemoprotein [Cyanobacteria bacterium RM1_2_2]
MALNIERLESSFSQIRDQGDQFTTHFYANLFADHPKVQPLFAKTNMQRQGKHLFDSLTLVVDNLRNSAVLVSTLKGLGTRHVQYGVLPVHYPMVGGALLKTLSICLGEAWTADVEQAWIEAYGAVTELMLAGADYPAETLTLQ